ncbi:hypothetical protein EV424DRAFT_1539845 [Suillus variegatus]|nr:hypothetical protein EV424DRAFT_1539845 [Suillus variegatus]
MQAALVSFHTNKGVFVEHRICLFGSADGFNTELPERLHIDFAKCVYRVSNHHDYVIQMTMWLHRQESIYLQDAYLHWRASQNPANKDSHSQDSDSSIDSGSDPSHRYFVPRTCPFPNLTFQHLVNKHSTSQVIPALEQLLRHNLHTQPHRKLTLQDHVDVYNTKCMFKVQASPEIAPKDTRKLPSPVHFYMVLMIKDCGEYTGEGILGLHIGGVKVMFNLHYIWTFNENLQSFQLTKSSWQHRPNAAILLVDQVLHPVHLAPQFSREAAEEFYLNRYIDLELFERLMYSGA